MLRQMLRNGGRHTRKHPRTSGENACEFAAGMPSREDDRLKDRQPRSVCIHFESGPDSYGYGHFFSDMSEEEAARHGTPKRSQIVVQNVLEREGGAGVFRLPFGD